MVQLRRVVLQTSLNLRNSVSVCSLSLFFLWSISRYGQRDLYKAQILDHITLLHSEYKSQCLCMECVWSACLPFCNSAPWPSPLGTYPASPPPPSPYSSSCCLGESTPPSRLGLDSLPFLQVASTAFWAGLSVPRAHTVLKHHPVTTLTTFCL